MTDHGGQVWGANGRRIVRLDFSANLWPERRVPMPGDLRALLEPYPDSECRALVAAASGYYNVPEDRIVAVNGSTEGLYLAMRMVRPRRLALFEPTFSEYEKAARWADGCVEFARVRTQPRDGFAPALELAAGDTIALGNPNNPTGVLVGRNILAPWLDANERAGVWTIVDEAFLDFAANSERQSLLCELGRWPHLLVLRSFTKRFGLAGLRLGFVFGSRESAARLRGLRFPWSVNALAQRVGISLARRKRDHGLAQRIARQREYLARRLRSLGFAVFPSAANFLLVRMPGGMSNRRLLGALRRRGIALRDASTFAGLDDSYLRCAIRPRAELRALVRAVEESL